MFVLPSHVHIYYICIYDKFRLSLSAETYTSLGPIPYVKLTCILFIGGIEL